MNATLARPVVRCARTSVVFALLVGVLIVEGDVAPPPDDAIAALVASRGVPR